MTYRPGGWLHRIRSLAPDAEFGPPAPEAVLAAAETALGHRLPPDLRALLEQADGIRVRGAAVVWPSARIVIRNQIARLAGDEPMLAFADAGHGDRFALLLRPRRRDVFVADPQDGYRMWTATNLEAFLEARLAAPLIPRPARP